MYASVPPNQGSSARTTFKVHGVSVNRISQQVDQAQGMGGYNKTTTMLNEYYPLSYLGDASGTVYTTGIYGDYGGFGNATLGASSYYVYDYDIYISRIDRDPSYYAPVPDLVIKVDGHDLPYQDNFTYQYGVTESGKYNAVTALVPFPQLTDFAVPVKYTYSASLFGNAKLKFNITNNTTSPMYIIGASEGPVIIQAGDYYESDETLLDYCQYPLHPCVYSGEHYLEIRGKTNNTPSDGDLFDMAMWAEYDSYPEYQQFQYTVDWGESYVPPTESYCSAVDDSAESGEVFGYSGIQYGTLQCLDIGPYNYTIFGIGLDIPYIAHMCFQSVNFGNMNLFGTNIPIDPLYLLIAVAWAIRALIH